MKKILFLILIFCAFITKAQKIEWAVQNGTAGNEYGNDIATNANGSSFIVGTFSTTMVFGTTTLTPTGNADGFIAMIDYNGNYLWAKKIGGLYYDEVNSVSIDNSGNAYITGSYTSKVFFSATDSLMGAGTTDTEIFVAKYNSSGVVQWKNVFWSNSFQNEHGRAIVVNATKNIAYVAGDVWNLTEIMIRAYNLTTGTLGGGLGTVEASPITVNDIAYRIVDATNDEVFIGGSFQGQFYENGSTSSTHSSVSGSKDLYVARFYSNPGASSLGCNLSHAGGGTGIDECYAVAARPNGDYYFTGSATGTFTISGTAFVNSGTDCFIVKYDNITNLQWLRQGKSSGTTIGRSLMLDSKGYAYIGGYGTAGTFKNTAANGLAASGLMLIKLMPTGDVASRVSVPSSSAAGTIRGISQDLQGNTYVIGNFNTAANFSVTNMTSAGLADICFAKINTTTINTPTVNSTKCVSTKDGEFITVNFLVSKKLNAANTFSLQVDTTGTSDFVSFFTLGTLASDTSGSISNYLPRGKYNYADFRIVSSNAAYTGDQSWIYIYTKLVAAVTPSAITRCAGTAASTLNASGSNDFGTTYSFTPTSGVSGGSNPFDFSPTSTTVYTLTSFNNNGCKDTVAFRVTVNATPTITFTPVTSTCPGGTVALTNTVSANVTSYTWSPSALLSSTSAAVPIVTPTITANINYTITTINNCTATGFKAVGLYSSPTVNAGPPSVKSCFGSTIPLIGTSNGNTYTWTPSAGIVNSTSLSATASPTGSMVYTLTAAESIHGCTTKDTYSVTIGNVSVDAGASQTITCGNNATLTANATGTFVTPYSYNWTPTVALTNYTAQTTAASPQTPKWYYVTMTTANGCSATDSVKVTSTEPNYGTTFSVTPSQLITLPSPAQFNNGTPSPSSYTFYWYFGDGTTLQSNNPSVFHVYQYNGNFDVTLVAVSNATGCADTLRIPGYVFVTGGTNCSATANVTAPNGLNGCVGDSVKLMANTGSGLTYQWMLNGVNLSGATFATYYAMGVGNYAVTVNNGSCAAISSSKYVSFNSPPNTPTITTTGNLNQCGGGTLFLNANGGYSSYNWSTGANTQNITITQSGVYTLTVSNTAGCKSSGNYSANTSALPAPDVCIVGMDSLTGVHKLVWNKPVTVAIDSFIIYREGIVANQFNRLAAQSYSTFSTYMDNTSAPATQAYRYKISLRDTCGIETLLSSYHKTIHLTINAGVGGAWNLIWNHYEGISFGTYNIYSGTALNNMTLLTSIASTNNSYTDLTPPPGTVYYQIEVVNPGSCNPTAKVAVNYSSSRSNIVNVLPTSVNGYYEMAESIQIMPNPFNDELTINIGKISSKNYTLVLTDVLGKIVIQKTDNNPTQQFRLSDLATGVYYLTIIDESNNRFTKKLIKN